MLDQVITRWGWRAIPAREREGQDAMDGKIITLRDGPASYVLLQERLYRVLYIIDSEDGPPVLALHDVGAVPQKPGGADEYESLLRRCQVQRFRWH
jgi:hypothetical protein